MSGFSSDDWNRHIAYLWLCSPTHDKRFAGKPTSIEKYSRPFDLDTIKREQGSGGYRLDLVRIATTGNKQQRIAQEYFQILDQKYPPPVPYGDWLSGP
jgi:hypothetical protein